MKFKGSWSNWNQPIEETRMLSWIQVMSKSIRSWCWTILMVHDTQFANPWVLKGYLESYRSSTHSILWSCLLVRTDACVRFLAMRWAPTKLYLMWHPPLEGSTQRRRLCRYGRDSFPVLTTLSSLWKLSLEGPLYSISEASVPKPGSIIFCSKTIAFFHSCHQPAVYIF